MLVWRNEEKKKGIKMKKKVIAAGHICLDITPVFLNHKVTDISSILRPGELIEMGKANVSTGGSVANTGLAMKILGADVTLIGKIGADEFGDMICSILKSYDVSDAMIRSQEQSTSYSVVLAVPGIDRIFLHNPGANMAFLASEVPDEVLAEASHFHFGYPTIMKSMYENDGAELVALFQKVKAAGLSTSLDLSSVDPDSDAGKANWYLILKNVMPYVDFFVPSIEEICFMLDKPRYEQWQKSAAGGDITEILTLEDIRPVAKLCMDLGAKVLLLKCGAPGLYYCTASKEVLAQVGSKCELDVDLWANKEGFEKSYKTDCVLSATGAGDTSIAAFLVGMLNGESPASCMQLAAATGACCVSAYDALSGLLPMDQLKEKIAGGWEKFS